MYTVLLYVPVKDENMLVHPHNSASQRLKSNLTPSCTRSLQDSWRVQHVPYLLLLGRGFILHTGPWECSFWATLCPLRSSLPFPPRCAHLLWLRLNGRNEVQGLDGLTSLRTFHGSLTFRNLMQRQTPGVEHNSVLHHLDVRPGPATVIPAHCLQMFLNVPHGKWFQQDTFLE